jgi:hypothetical protein
LEQANGVQGWKGIQNRNGTGREWTTRVDFGEIGKKKAAIGRAEKP